MRAFFSSPDTRLENGFDIHAVSTTAGKTLQVWLEAFNSGSPQVYDDFIRKMLFPGVADMFQYWNYGQPANGFDFRKIEESTADTKLTALLQERDSDLFVHLTLELEEAKPHRILAIEAWPTQRPAEFPVQHMSESDLLAVLQTSLQEEAVTDRFSGAVLLAKGRKPIFAQAYGSADRGRNIPNTLVTRFRNGSMNKMFTGVATLQLVQEGKLHLDDPIGKYLTDYPNKGFAGKVTIHHLLAHTGGTGNIFGPEFDAHRLELRTHGDYVKLYGNRDLRFEPGSRWEYSNYGFVLLGVIIEKISDKNYYDYVRNHIYNPAGMTLTGSEPEDHVVTDLSIGYMGAPGSLHVNTDTLPYRGTAAGGGYSTVEDLAKFANAIGEKALLNARFTEMLTAGKVDTPDRGRYAYGFDDRMLNGTHCFGHGGGAPGMNGHLEICPENGYVVAVLANRDPRTASRVSDFITSRLPII